MSGEHGVGLKQKFIGSLFPILKTSTHIIKKNRCSFDWSKTEKVQKSKEGTLYPV